MLDSVQWTVDSLQCWAGTVLGRCSVGWAVALDELQRWTDAVKFGQLAVERVQRWTGCELMCMAKIYAADQRSKPTSPTDCSIGIVDPGEGAAESRLPHFPFPLLLVLSSPHNSPMSHLAATPTVKRPWTLPHIGASKLWRSACDVKYDGWRCLDHVPSSGHS